jgi:hypothetical protein
MTSRNAQHVRNVNSASSRWLDGSGRSHRAGARQQEPAGQLRGDPAAKFLVHTRRLLGARFFDSYLPKQFRARISQADR